MKLGEGWTIVRAVYLGEILRSAFPFGPDLDAKLPYEVTVGALASLDFWQDGAFGDAMKAMAP